jgi:hypothetical protein
MLHITGRTKLDGDAADKLLFYINRMVTRTVQHSCLVAGQLMDTA